MGYFPSEQFLWNKSCRRRPQVLLPHPQVFRRRPQVFHINLPTPSAGFSVAFPVSIPGDCPFPRAGMIYLRGTRSNRHRVAYTATCLVAQASRGTWKRCRGASCNNVRWFSGPQSRPHSRRTWSREAHGKARETHPGTTPCGQAQRPETTSTRVSMLLFPPWVPIVRPGALCLAGLPSRRGLRLGRPAVATEYSSDTQAGLMLGPLSDD